MPYTKFLVAILLLGLANAASADSTIYVPTFEIALGQTTEFAVTLTTDESIRGFSFGLSRNGGVAFETASEGAAVLALNGGAGADFFLVNLFPANGAGVVVGCVFSTAPPIEEMGPGSNFELVRVGIELDSAQSGTSYALELTDTLGAPPVLVMVSIAGQTQIPNIVNGGFTVITPPVDFFLCQLDDPCICEVSVIMDTYLNYTELRIFVDGVDQQLSLSGDELELDLTLTPGDHEICIQGMIQGEWSALTCCTISCSNLPPLPVDDLVCTTNSETCEAVLSWTNTGIYSSLKVTRDGQLIQTLAGDAESTVLDLGSSDLTEICIYAIGSCGQNGQVSCCTVSSGVIEPGLIEQLVCDVDSACVATLSWTNTSTDGFIELVVNGQVLQILDGAESQAQIDIQVDVDTEICLTPFNSCGVYGTAICCTVSCDTLFVRGDCNTDGSNNIADAIEGLSALFLAGPINCVDACDSNDDGMFDISDIVYLLSSLFSGGTEPAAPYPSCGADPTEDSLRCEAYPACD